MPSFQITVLCVVATLLLVAATSADAGKRTEPGSWGSDVAGTRDAYHALVDAEHTRANGRQRVPTIEQQRESRRREGAAKRQSGGLFDLPIAGYISWGRTHTNTTGSPQNYYTFLNDQAYRTVVYQVNEVLGGVLLNGSRYVINDINYNDGADCTLMKILYEYMVDTDGAQFLFSPTSYDCSVLAKFAESRDMLFGNGADASLLILEFTNGTTPYDTDPWAVNITYTGLQWTYNLQNDIATYFTSCGTAMTDPTYIDQSGVAEGDPPARIRTMAFAANEAEVPGVTLQCRAVLLGLNVTEVYPVQDLSLDDLLTEQCTYLDNGTFDGWMHARPDFTFLITGASNGSLGYTCMHERHYQPPLTMSPTDVDPTFAAWQVAGMVRDIPFFASIDFTDPVMGTFSNFVTIYETLFDVVPTFYEFGIASTAIVLLDCINSTQSLDQYVVRECIRAYNKTTMYGAISFVQPGWYLPRPNVCVQRHDNYTDLVVFPLDYPARVPMLFPYPFVFNQTWLDQFNSPAITTVQWGLIGMGIAILVILLVVLVVFLVATKIYHVIFIPKDEHNDEWGA
jgi:hypothetical protein